MPCGPDTGRIVQAVKKCPDAGYPEMSPVQIGPEQNAYCDYFERELGPELRKL